MRISLRPRLATTLLLLVACASVAQPARADDGAFDGNWKLVVLPFGSDEFAIVKLTDRDGKTAATMVDAQRTLGLNDVKSAERKDGVVTLAITGQAGETTFKGSLAKEGPDAGQFLGMVSFRGSTYPARLEETKASKVAALTPSALRNTYKQIMESKDTNTKVKKLEEAIDGNHRAPSSALFYTELLSSAQAASLDAEKVASVIKKWSDEARPYGDAWASEIRLKALKAIASSKAYAKLTVGLAQEVDKSLGEEALETKATVIELLASAAHAAGMTELARESDARHAKINARLDEEYHRKVPPFSPTPYAGRKDKSADHVVLMELFTGAQCPPCVAADVAFDALLKTYKPADFIGLQYHLHIPGPDPLTNRDSMARQEYYGSDVHGTPSTFFNGHSEAAGGGPMANSGGKYTQYRAIIDKALESARGATIDLSATRAGDQIKIAASARVAENGGEKAKEGGDKFRPVLRLALTEESVRYVGSNKLRFHHHVVRALPGGADGKELKDGAGKIDVTIDLAELKRNLESYLSDYAKTRPFPTTTPEIKFENLAVVAFVQDDSDKRVLHAVSVPVENARP